MAEVVTIEAPKGVKINRGQLNKPSISPRVRGGGAGKNITQELHRALESTDFDLVETVSIDATRGPSPAVRRRSKKHRNIDLSVKVSENESALILVDNDGYFEWFHPENINKAAPSPQQQRQDRGKILQFSLELGSSPSGVTAPTYQNRNLLKKIKNLIFDKAVLYVVKFIVRKGLEKISDWVDGDGPFGLFRMSGSDPKRWYPAKRNKIGKFKSTKSKRVLLWIHGTFSTTQGSFSNLALNTSTHQTFLSEIYEEYDDVIAFDHKTLGITTSENARDLREELSKIDTKYTYIIDIISYSRGGLVARQFIENELSYLANYELGKSIFVGSTLAGTELANSKNWDRLLSLYSNTIAGATRAFGAVIGASHITEPAAAVVKTLGRFAQIVVETGVDDQAVPGLYSMSPNGTIVKEILKSQSIRPSNYYAVISNFEPKSKQGAGLKAATQFLIADGVADRLFNQDNDLVVNTKSMRTLTNNLDIRQILNLRSDKAIYHTIYFAQPNVIQFFGSILLGNSSAYLSVSGARSLQTGSRASRKYRRSDIKENTSRQGNASARRRAAPVSRSRSIRSLGSSPDSVVANDEILDSGTEEGQDVGLIDVRATTDEIYKLGESSKVVCYVSREGLASAQSAIDKGGSSKARLQKPVDVSIVPLTSNIEVYDDHFQIQIPELGARENAHVFSVKAISTGQAILRVQFSQDNVVINSLELCPVVSKGAGQLEVRETLDTISRRSEGIVLQVFESFNSGVPTLYFHATSKNPVINFSGSTSLKSSEDYQLFFHRLLREIENSWGDGKSYNRIMDNLRGRGSVLYDYLIPDQLKGSLEKNWDKISCIEIVTKKHLIPWELLYVPKKGFFAEKGMSRWRPNVPWGSTSLQLGEFRYLCPTYINSPLPGARDEVNALKSIYNGEELNPDYDSLSGFLRDPKNTGVLHIACHGQTVDPDTLANFSSELLLSDTQGDTISADAIGGMANFSDSPDLIVFLNACQVGQTGGVLQNIGGFAEAFLNPSIGNPGVAAFIAPLWSVGDMSAETFSLTFYESLSNGDNLNASFLKARLAAKELEDPTWLAYSLYGNPAARVI